MYMSVRQVGDDRQATYDVHRYLGNNEGCSVSRWHDAAIDGSEGGMPTAVMVRTLPWYLQGPANSRQVRLMGASSFRQDTAQMSHI
jgi:hypothetical protein